MSQARGSGHSRRDRFAVSELRAFIPGGFVSGICLLLLWMEGSRRLRVGSLGPVGFPAGLYLYVGSARRGLGARIERHRRQVKPPRWHIDYLARHAPLLGAAVAPWAPGRECQLARAVMRFLGARVVAPRFGSSDCDCPAHLAHLEGAARARPDGQGGDAMKAVTKKTGEADLKTLAALAKELGASAGALRKAAQAGGIQPDEVRCGCAYYGPKARAAMKKLVKA